MATPSAPAVRDPISAHSELSRRTIVRFMFLRPIVVAAAVVVAVSTAGRARLTAAEPRSAAEGAGSGRRAPAAASGRGTRWRRRPPRLHPADDRQPVQLRRARLPGVRDPALPHRDPRAGGFRDRAGDSRHAERLARPVGFRTTGDRARQRCRRHPQVVADTRRGVPPAADRRGAGARRGPQLRPGPEHRRGARGGRRSWSGRSSPARC